FDCDWSSDVCSSDLFGMPTEYPTGDTPAALIAGALGGAVLSIGSSIDLFTTNFDGDNVTWLHNNGEGKFESPAPTTISVGNGPRSEERRIGKEGRAR